MNIRLANPTASGSGDDLTHQNARVTSQIALGRTAADSPIAEILDPKYWPIPNWSIKKDTKKYPIYDKQFLFQLRSRYTRLEYDFRSVLGNFPESVDIITAGRIADLLHSARQSLEAGETDLPVLSSSLDLADRLMVWLYPNWVAKARIEGMLFRIESMDFDEKDRLRERLEGLSKADRESYLGEIRSVLDEAIGLVNEKSIEDRIGRGLQISRLKALRTWGILILALFLGVAPLSTSTKDIAGWPSQQILSDHGIAVLCWMNAFAVMTFGAMGGFLSGLLQARSTRITLIEYLESMLRLQLRPIVGALVALIIYTILSWQVLPGISIVNAGSYFLIAFLSGFSERYFLRLLKADPEGLDGESSGGDAQQNTRKLDRPPAAYGGAQPAQER